VYKCRHSYMAARYLIDLCQPVASIDGRRHPRSASRGQLQVPRIKMTTYVRAFGHADPSTWNALPNTFKCSSHCLPIFRSSKTFLLFVLLAHRARSRLLQLTRYINYLLTYLRSQMTLLHITQLPTVKLSLLTGDLEVHRE